MPCKRRLNLYFHDELARRIETLATEQRLGKSAIVEAAVASFLAPNSGDRQEAVLARRLDRLSHQFESLERDQAIGLETLALFVRYFLTVTPTLPEADQVAARAHGKARYERFIESLGRRLQRGQSLLLDLEPELAPSRPSSGSSSAAAADLNGQSVLANGASHD